MDTFETIDHALELVFRGRHLGYPMKSLARAHFEPANADR